MGRNRKKGVPDMGPGVKYYITDLDGGAVMGPLYTQESAARALATCQTLYPFETLIIFEKGE
jgi:hypothetical protein